MIVNVFVAFHERGIVLFALLQLTERRTARNTYPSSWQPKNTKRKKLEVVGVNVSNIRLCNWQCTHHMVPCVKISVIGQAHET